MGNVFHRIGVAVNTPAKKLKITAASFSVIFTTILAAMSTFPREIPQGDKMRDSRELPGSQQIANKPCCQGVLVKGEGKGLEIYANASVNKRNEARC